jgi:hypothetical protein
VATINSFPLLSKRIWYDRFMGNCGKIH